MNKSPDTIASFAKGLRVIEAFSADAPRQTITEIASATGFDRATARRCLLTLHAEGYADYDGKFFTLTPRVLRLGLAALSSMPLPQVVQPWLDQLSETIGQSCSVSIREEGEIVYIARAAQKRLMSIGLMPGSRLPLHCTSMGRVLLAALPDTEVEALLSRADLSPRTPFSKTGLDSLMQEVRRVRQTGFALVDQEVEPGLRSLAVPVVNHRGQTLAAMNIGVAAIQPSPRDVVDAYLPALRKVQDGLKSVLT